MGTIVVDMLVSELAKLDMLYDDMQDEYIRRKAEIVKGVQEELDALDAELLPEIEAAGLAVTAKESELRKVVVATKESITKDKYRIVYSKPRETWDGKLLDGYAAAHPEILAFKKIGEASARITRL